jgi:PHD/YefM family antitoxin component YafN of YafNO toxin-antitoxin module
VADEATETNEPIFITNNGKGELVVMSECAYEELRMRPHLERAIRRIKAAKEADSVNYIPFEDAVKNLAKYDTGRVAEKEVGIIYDGEKV